MSTVHHADIAPTDRTGHDRPTQPGPEHRRATRSRPGRRRRADAGRELPAKPVAGHRVRERRHLLRRLPAVRDVSLVFGKQRDHRADRAVRLRQVHRAAVAEPDERPGPGARVDREDHLPRPGHLRRRTSTRSRCAAASAWCSRSRTRSRSPSTTTSPTAPGSPA